MLPAEQLNVSAVLPSSLTIAEAEFETSVLEFTVGDSHALLGQQLGIRLVNLNEIPDGFTILGITVIICSGIYSIHREAQLARAFDRKELNSQARIDNTH